MAITLYDRVKAAVSGTPGTGAVAVGTASPGYRAPATAGASDGETIPVVFEDGAAWEESLCVLSSSATVLTRTLVRSSTGSLLSLTSAAIFFISPFREQLAQGLTLLATLTAATSASLDFTGISSAYDCYHIEFENVVPDTGTSQFLVRVGTGVGPTYDATNYTDLAGSATGLRALNSTAGNALTFSPTGIGVNGLIRFANPNAANGKPASGVVVGAAGGQAGFFNGYYNQATVVTALRFMFASGNIASGKIRIYGVVTS